MTRNVIQIRWAWFAFAVWLACDFIFSWTGLPWESTRILKGRLGDTFAVACFLAALSICFRDKAMIADHQTNREEKS